MEDLDDDVYEMRNNASEKVGQVRTLGAIRISFKIRQWSRLVIS